jgi:HSP20 family protein
MIKTNKRKENKVEVPVSTSKAERKPAITALHPLADMERLFERFFGRGWPSLRQWPGTALPASLSFEQELRLPSVDVIDRDGEILVRAEVPGVEKKDLDISLTDNLLTIKGRSGTDKKEEKGDYHWHEISSSSFARSVLLPGSVSSSKVSAELNDGVLEITLPKVESSKRRSIPVT